MALLSVYSGLLSGSQHPEERKVGCVYEITFPDDSRYVGATSLKLSRRMSLHKSPSGNTKKLKVSEAITKFGYDSISVDNVFETDDMEIIYLLESELIASRRKKGFNLHNVASGGKGPAGFSQNIESREKNSRSNISRYLNKGPSSSVLKEADVLQILELLKTDMKQTEIASIFGVTRGVINRIKKGRSWSFVLDRLKKDE